LIEVHYRQGYIITVQEIYMNFISPNTAAQYNIECKTEIQNIQVIGPTEKVTQS